MLEKFNVNSTFEETKCLMKRLPIKMKFTIYTYSVCHRLAQQLKSPKRDKVEKIIDQIYTLGRPIAVLSSKGKSLDGFELSDGKLGEFLMKYFKQYPRPSDVYIMFDRVYGTRVSFDDLY